MSKSFPDNMRLRRLRDEVLEGSIVFMMTDYLWDERGNVGYLSADGV